MDFLVKIGSKYPDLNDAKHYSQWRDGQIIDFGPDGTWDKDKFSRLHHGIIRFPDIDFWDIRGTMDWKAASTKIYTLKKLIETPEANGLFRWELPADYERAVKPNLKRLYFFDFTWLLTHGYIDLTQFESIYDKSRIHVPIVISGTSFYDLIKNELADQRLSTEKDTSRGTVSTGTYTIGAAGTYATVTAAEADIDATMTGNLTFEHLNEQTAISNYVIFDTNTSGFLLKLTAQAGAEHTGAVYGNGARVLMGTYDAIYFDETTDGHLGNVEVSKLALDASGEGNLGIYTADLGGTLLLNRLLVKGGSSSYSPIRAESTATLNVRNCIIYGATNASHGFLRLGATASNVFNNTIVKCYYGIVQMAGTITVKNNIVQGCTSSNFSGSFTTNGYNLSEDATSPDVAYRSINLHDGNSCFLDYDNNDYRLSASGDEISTLDDAEDLSGTFTDDIRGVTRSTWYMGAYELVAASSSSSSSSSSSFSSSSSSSSFSSSSSSSSFSSSSSSSSFSSSSSSSSFSSSSSSSSFSSSSSSSSFSSSSSSSSRSSSSSSSSFSSSSSSSSFSSSSSSSSKSSSSSSSSFSSSSSSSSKSSSSSSSSFSSSSSSSSRSSSSSSFSSSSSSSSSRSSSSSSQSSSSSSSNSFGADSALVFNFSASSVCFGYDEVKKVEVANVQKVDRFWKQTNYYHQYKIGPAYKVLKITLDASEDYTVRTRAESLYQALDAYYHPVVMTSYYEYYVNPITNINVQLDRDAYRFNFNSGYESSPDIEMVFVQTN